MDQCQVLPATGNNVTAIVVAAAIVAALGVTTLLLVRRRAMPMLAVVLVAGIVAIGVPAHAATGCPPASTAPTVAPTPTTTSTSPTTTSVAVAPSAPPTSTTTTSTTSTTTSTTSTTTTTAPPLEPPIAVPDAAAALPFNVLANDDLGSPPATITEWGFTTLVTCGGVSFDPATGVLSGTLPAEACLLEYTIANSVGLDDAVALVLPVGG